MTKSLETSGREGRDVSLVWLERSEVETAKSDDETLAKDVGNFRGGSLRTLLAFRALRLFPNVRRFILPLSSLRVDGL